MHCSTIDGASKGSRLDRRPLLRPGLIGLALQVGD